MLDYEIYEYVLDYLPRDKTKSITKNFKSEDTVINYIKDNRKDWASYKLLKIQHAIIEF